jgi:hypothetical protein
VNKTVAAINQIDIGDDLARSFFSFFPAAIGIWPR